jgi:nicotinamide riboside transporter PnuC
VSIYHIDMKRPTTKTTGLALVAVWVSLFVLGAILCKDERYGVLSVLFFFLLQALGWFLWSLARKDQDENAKRLPNDKQQPDEM